MKYRVIHPHYFPTYFKTKRAAILFQNQIGGTIERKIGYNWVRWPNCPGAISCHFLGKSIDK